jgi:curved DNA-binding protein
MSTRDYYEILGLRRNATPDEIKQAYRTLAKRYHPDRNPDTPEATTRFKEVQEAYEVLNDSEKRSFYDRHGHASPQADSHVGEWRTAPGGQRAYTSGGPGMEFDIEDLLRGMGGVGDLFGNRGKQRPGAPQADLDVHTEARVSFEQALNGTTVEFKLSATRGQPETVHVKVPAGVEDGQVIRLRGKGSAGKRGQRGDVLIKCRVGSHAFFRREKADIHLDLPISPFEAMLGAQVEVPTLDGRTTVTVPPLTASGAKLRLRNKGILLANQRGHQILHVQIVPPHNLDPDELAELRGLQERIDHHPRADLWS